MIRLRQIVRFVHINLILLRYGLDELLLGAPWVKPFHFLIYLRPWAWLQNRRDPPPVRLRQALERLGPIFVKLGQMLSTRADLLPKAYADELSRLQDQVPPFPGKIAKRHIEQAFGKPVSEIFSDFSEEPLASASIAQVHAAKLPDGSEVVVKVLRPDIRRVIDDDLALMYLFAKVAERYLSEARRLRASAVIAEYDRTIHDELDLIREGANAAQLKRNFDDSPLLYVPAVYWDYTRPGVLVLEQIRGIPIDDHEALRDAGTNFKRLAENGVEIFFTQVFKHNFFHADMHPGNIFIDVSDPSFPVYEAVDFGIIGTLSLEDQRYLAENFLAFFNRDYDRVAELHVSSGWVPKNTPVNEFAAAVRSVCEPIFNRPLKDISFGQVLVRLFQTARRFHMEVQPQLVLLQKTLLHIEGLGRQLYPDLDLWHTAKPFLEDWMHDRVGPRGIWRQLQADWPEMGPAVLEGPKLAYRVLQQMSDGQVKVQLSDSALSDLIKTINEHRKEQRLSLAGAAFIIAGSIILAWGHLPSWVAWTLGGLGVLLSLISFRSSILNRP